MTPTIRRAADADIEACAALYERVGQAHFTWKPADTFRQRDFAAIAFEEEVWIIGAETPIAGFLSYYPPDHFVHLLFIADACRQRGLGRALLAHIRRHYATAHSLKVNEQNGAARAFYDALGYRQVAHGASDGVVWLRLASP